MRILVDMDGVIADFERGFLTQWRARYPHERFIPLDQRTTYYAMDQYPSELRETVRQICWAPHFYRTLASIEGGPEALAEMKRLGLEVFTGMLFSTRGFFQPA